MRIVAGLLMMAGAACMLSLDGYSRAVNAATPTPPIEHIANPPAPHETSRVAIADSDDFVRRGW